LCLVCYSVVLLGRETGSLQLLAPLLLTGGKGADLMIRGNVVLNRAKHGHGTVKPKTKDRTRTAHAALLSAHLNLFSTCMTYTHSV
jgi:hypothetical protein